MSHDAPRALGRLDVGEGQRIYWEEWGKADGVPAVYLHGGPGGGLATSRYRLRFDLTRTRVVGFEQRGCGRSTPHAADPGTSLAANTTAHLVADMERLREHLGIRRWIVNGVSWGSTLAVAYAQAHPERVAGVVLFAVTTTSRAEVDWITEGVGTVFPEAWDRLATYAEEAGVGYRRGNSRVVEAYRRLMESPDPGVRERASWEWARWEDTHVAIGAGRMVRDPRWEDERFRLAFVRLCTHYWAHDGFCDPPLLEGMDRLAGIPATLIHGRRDISSPAVTAWMLHRRWSSSTLVVDEGDGHGGASMGERWRAANHDLVTTVLDRAEG
ncbi:alpha/beta fold hydrolase [Nostocoides sp. Soil756]|uniref:alpha/beta fold hydrolase n=1 Tax=Nostocoides sp. Soil756 TaxID=1736399 RepID=UPI0006F6B07E|nr:alpha/beta fold hydrolase [Tetrasphaera sp. Soil756]KRE61710.1 proline iminopeptidase [Tetrasphaera sp. Soil756]